MFYFIYIFNETSSSELIPGGGIEEGNETSSSKSITSTKAHKFETMICTTLTEMNDKALSNMERIISKMQQQKSEVNIATTVNNVMSALNNLEDRKRKLESEVSGMDEGDAKVRKLSIIEKIDRKIDLLYDEM